MRKVLLVLVSLFLLIGRAEAQSEDPCEILKVFVDQMSAQLPVKVGEISTFKSIYINGGYVVEENIYHNYPQFEGGYNHPKSYKKSLMKNWASNNLLRKQAKMFLDCDKQLKSIVKNDINALTFEIIFTTEDLENIVKGK